MGNSIVSVEQIDNCIHLIRSQRVMLDSDLAILYGVPTKRLNEQVRRNIDRFPGDFMFQLSKEELENGESQAEMSDAESSRSQFATLKRGQNIKYRPFAFTEQGVAMLSSVLRSSLAVSVNIEIMRAFVRMRHVLESNRELAKSMGELRSFVLKKSNKVDQEFRRVWKEFEKRLQPPSETRKIGFRLD